MKHRKFYDIIKPTINTVFFVFSMIYLEIVFHMIISTSFDFSLLHIIMFSFSFAIVLSVITSLFGEKANYIIALLMQGGISLYYCAQLIYFRVFKTFMAVVSISQGAGQAIDFWKEILNTILKNIHFIILIWIPFIFIAIFGKKLIDYTRKKFLNIEIQVLLAGIIFVLAVLLLDINGTNLYSPYDLYYNTNSIELSMNKLGLITTTRLDVQRIIKENLQKDDEVQRFPHVTLGVGDFNKISYSGGEDAIGKPNTMNINFAQLINNESNSVLIDMHQYFSQADYTLKNQYTGMFEGYNLIYITAESLSGYGINEEYMPTLYKMKNEGFVFENFYNPLWYLSTIDGEYVNCLSQIPKSGAWSFQQASSNSLPFALGNQLNALGYNSYAYHDHDSYYYDRTSTHASIGYDFKALDAGLEVTRTWPESDLEMFEETINEYASQQPFNVYFMTVSGHLPYNFTDNAMSIKNEAAVANLNMSEACKAYYAANIELENGINYLIKTLEARGILDNTVIVIAPDHYPYNLDGGYYNELAGSNVEADSFEMYRSSLIIWCNDMDKKIEVEKYCSSMDILPTISNLFGLEYDSRLLMGRDILSTSTPLIYFSDRSFMTDKIKYNAQTGQVTYLTDEIVSDEYVEEWNKIVSDKFNYSAKILDYDYFKVVFSNTN